MAPFRKPSTHGFERVANFRDMGGHRTHDGRRLRSGVLFRSGHLGRATDADVQRLAALGLRRVFDFRTQTDIRMDGADRLPPGAEHVQLPMPDPARGEDIRELIASNPERLQELFGDGRAAALMVRGAAHIASASSPTPSSSRDSVARERFPRSSTAPPARIGRGGPAPSFCSLSAFPKTRSASSTS